MILVGALAISYTIWDKKLNRSEKIWLCIVGALLITIGFYV